MSFIVELEPGCWLAYVHDLHGPWRGYPGFTCIESSAQRYKTEAAAKGALTRARRFRPFRMAKIVEVTR